MRKRAALLGTVGAALVVVTVCGLPSLQAEWTDDSKESAIAPDRMTLPDSPQTYSSGDYQLVISNADGWRSPTTTAVLYKAGAPLWEKELPHQYGPRFTILSSTGQVALFDEYINVASAYAITILSAQGETISTYSFDDIHRLLQQADQRITRSDITRASQYGWWISAHPYLIQTDGIQTDGGYGRYVRVETADTALQIDLSNGVIVPSPS